MLKLTDENNNTGWGEASPLEGFSIENSDDALEAFGALRQSLINKEIPQNIIEQIIPLPPSVQLAVESSLLNLTAASKDLSLVELLNPNAHTTVNLNSLITAADDDHEIKIANAYQDGFRTVKLKVSKQNIHDLLNLLAKIYKEYGTSLSIRLDANRSFDYIEALELLENLKQFNIEYIEEPFPNSESMKRYLKEEKLQTPVALDETIREISPDNLSEFALASAVILKPTMLGFTKTMNFARQAINLDMKPIISSSFESPVGILNLAHMAATIDHTLTCGLDTLSFFGDDWCQTIQIENGRLDLLKHRHIFDIIPEDILDEVNFD